MSEKSKITAGLLAFLPVAGIMFLVFWLPFHLQEVIDFSEEHMLVGPAVIIAWRVLGIVIPPIPGGILSFALIPVFGWFWSFIYAGIGILIGTTIAFWLARKYREPLVMRLVPLQQLHKWQDRVTGKKEFLAFLGVRIVTGPVLDFISYVAGLSKISFKKFFLATIITILPAGFSYYIGEKIYNIIAQESVYVGMTVFLLFVGIFYVIMKRQSLKGK